MLAIRNYRWLAPTACLLSVACSDAAGAGTNPGAVAGAGAGTSAGATVAGTGPGAAGVSGGIAVPAAGRGAAGVPAAGSGGGPAGSGAAGAAADDDAGTEPTPPAEDAGVDAGPPPPRSTGPGDWVPGDYPPGLMGSNFLELTGLPGQMNNVRQYKVHVPPSYDPKVPAPVVFCFHGLGQDALLFCVSGASMPAKSDAEGFILVMPNGVANSWNAGTCCGDASTQKLDDIGFVRAVFQEISKHLNIDLTRVYATGLSNGGYMSYRLACEASDIFAAVAPGAGAIGMDDIGGGTNPNADLEACNPTEKVSVLHLHGTEDGLIPYALQKQSLDRIAERNGCQTTTRPATQPMSAGDTTCVSYECPAGVDVTGCSVQGGGHVWFGSKNCGTGVDAACGIVGANSTTLVNTDAAWSFFEAHPRE
jgi:polyhydroxybutyrate depolymerase